MHPNHGSQIRFTRVRTLGSSPYAQAPYIRTHGSQTLSSLTTGHEHMDLFKSFAAATEDSWMIISSDTIGEPMLSMQVKSPESPKGLFLNQGILKPDPDPVFYREVDLSNFPQDIPRILNLGSFYVVTLRRWHTRPREQLLLNYNTQRHAAFLKKYLNYRG